VVRRLPLLGDTFDFVWKANDRNFALLMRHRGDLPARASLGYWLSVAGLLALGAVCVAAPVALVVWIVFKLSS
jgi:hypothetical protein